MGFEEDRYVCRVGICNIDDLLLGLASSRGELSYFGFLCLSTPELKRC